MAMMPSPWSETDYHVDAIARDLAEQHPDVQRVREDLRKQVAAAVNACRGECQRQNRSSADRYGMPPVRVDANPTGAQTKGRGK